MTDLLELLALELWRGEHDLAVSGVIPDVIKVGVPLVAGILHGTRVKSGHTEIKKNKNFGIFNMASALEKHVFAGFLPLEVCEAVGLGLCDGDALVPAAVPDVGHEASRRGRHLLRPNSRTKIHF